MRRTAWKKTGYWCTDTVRLSQSSPLICSDFLKVCIWNASLALNRKRGGNHRLRFVCFTMLTMSTTTKRKTFNLFYLLSGVLIASPKTSVVWPRSKFWWRNQRSVATSLLLRLVSVNSFTSPSLPLPPILWSELQWILLFQYNPGKESDSDVERLRRVDLR